MMRDWVLELGMLRTDKAGVEAVMVILVIQDFWEDLFFAFSFDGIFVGRDFEIICGGENL